MRSKPWTRSSNGSPSNRLGHDHHRQPTGSLTFIPPVKGMALLAGRCPGHSEEALLPAELRLIRRTQSYIVLARPTRRSTVGSLPRILWRTRHPSQQRVVSVRFRSKSLVAEDIVTDVRKAVSPVRRRRLDETEYAPCPRTRPAAPATDQGLEGLAKMKTRARRKTWSTSASTTRLATREDIERADCRPSKAMQPTTGFERFRGGFRRRVDPTGGGRLRRRGGSRVAGGFRRSFPGRAAAGAARRRRFGRTTSPWTNGRIASSSPGPADVIAHRARDNFEADRRRAKRWRALSSGTGSPSPYSYHDASKVPTRSMNFPDTKAGGPFIEAQPETNAILVKASKEQFAEVVDIIKAMGEMGGALRAATAGSPSKFPRAAAPPASPRS